MKTIEKLLPEHIVGYLPFELHAEMLDYKRDYVNKKYDVIIGIHQWDSRNLYWSALTVGGSKPELNSIKPILRKLSSITPEELKLFTIDFQMSYESPLFDYNLIPFCDIQTCCILHLDYQDLIGSGLAIDKQTLK